MDAARPETHPPAPADELQVAAGPADARLLISDLCTYLEEYLTLDQVREVYRAYLFGAEAHEGQKRLSGEPYIYHPVAVARILAEAWQNETGEVLGPDRLGELRQRFERALSGLDLNPRTS